MRARLRHLTIAAVAGAACAPGANTNLPPERVAQAPEPIVKVNLQYEASLAPFLAQYCISCHGGEHSKADLNFANIINGVDALARRRDLAKALEKVSMWEMPPAKAHAQPESRARVDFTIHATAFLRNILPEEIVPPGRVVVRRLSRYEYDRTILDLLNIHYDSSRAFPSDSPGDGFDNIGDVATVSPLLFEKYFDAARDITDRLLQQKEHPLQNAGAAEIRGKIEILLKRAFRRAPSPQELTARVELYNSTLAASGDSEAARAVYHSILVSPSFLFRIERGAPKLTTGEAPLTSHEIATRLSYLFWSTMPDAELFAAADRGDLTNPELLRSQAARMLQNEKARALADSFGAQWLRYREILSRAVDFRRFPKFNDGLRHWMYEESARFFDSIVREDRPIYEILDSTEGYWNETLADFYKTIETPPEFRVKGAALQKITIPDRTRGGMLAMGSVLTVTSYPLRTSPVLRGKYILEQIFHDPPSPPPADVPALPKDDVSPDGMTPRARLERHRADAACARCHNVIDPPGLAFENYDGIGEWRDQFQKSPIDATVVLNDGTRVDGPAAMRGYLISQKDRFLRAFAERLFVYAVGRPVDGNDEALLRRLVDNCKNSGYRFKTLALDLASSRAFLNIQIEPPPEIRDVSHVK